MYFAIYATDGPGASQTRSDLFEDFRSYLHDHPDHPDIVLHHAGQTLAEEDDTIVGSLLVVEAPSLEAAQAFVADSPYGKAGVFGDVQVRRWNWITGRPG